MSGNPKTHDSSTSPKFILHLAIVIIVFVLLLATGIWLYFAFFSSSLLAPFPDYPNQANIKFDAPLPDVLRYYECQDGPFLGLEYKVFATEDSKEQVYGFYHQIITQPGKSALAESGGRSSNHPEYPKNFICFQNAQPKKRGSPPTNVIVYLDPADSRDIGIIRKAFPNVPANMLIVILLQGYVSYI